MTQEDSGCIGISLSRHVGQIENVTEANKLNLLINHIDTAVCEYIFEAGTYNEAIQILSDTFAKTPSSLFARYALMSCKQLTAESLDIYLKKIEPIERRLQLSSSICSCS